MLALILEYTADEIAWLARGREQPGENGDLELKMEGSAAGVRRVLRDSVAVSRQQRRGLHKH